MKEPLVWESRQDLYLVGWKRLDYFMHLGSVSRVGGEWVATLLYPHNEQWFRSLEDAKLYLESLIALEYS